MLRKILKKLFYIRIRVWISTEIESLPAILFLITLSCVIGGSPKILGAKSWFWGPKGRHGVVCRLNCVIHV